MGVVVDTHVHRISRRLELTKADDPKNIEQDLMKVIPQTKWIDFSHQIIHHGRALCIARRPKCAECPLENICHAADKTWSTVEIHKAASRKKRHRVVVVNPHQFKVISESVKKTDRNDAAALALYLEKDLLPEVRMKPKQNRELMHLAETRDLLVKQRSALKGKINKLLAMQGIELKREALSSKIALERVLAFLSVGWCKLELRVLVEQIRSLSESIAELDEQLEEEGRQLHGYENLTSIKGIGSLSATVLLTVIGKISDFAKATARTANAIAQGLM